MTKADKDHISRLFPAIRKIQNEGIREKVILTAYHAWKGGNFEHIEDAHQWEPVRSRISYTNVEHTNQVCQASEKMADLLEEMLKIRIQRDNLLAGAILHDVDKLVIFDARSGGFRESGGKLKHAETGASLARKEGLPEEVAHIIEAHSPTYSSTPPKTMEALIVHVADLLIARGVYIAKGLDLVAVIRESMPRGG